MSHTGTLVISLDTELAWGKHDLHDYRHLHAGHAQRDNVTRMLELFDRYRVPVTWAMVGHLFLDACDGEHADAAYAAGWFDEDPGTSLERDPLWYGTDLVAAIRAAAVPHEIGLHSFSHVVFDRASPQCARAEMQRSLAAAAALGIEPVSFVFPRDRVGNLDALRAAGIRIYRTPTAERYRGWPLPARLKKLVRECFFLTTSKAARLTDEGGGFYSLTTSMNLAGWGRLDGQRKELYQRCKLLKIVRSLRAAGARGGILHLAAHPHNFADETDLAYLEEALRAVHELVEQGALRVRTMAGLLE